MILESAVLDVKPGQRAAFEAAFERARSILAAAAGYVSHELRRSVEKPDRYLLLVRWRTLEDHTEGFRRSTAYQGWKELLHHFYDPFPAVEHFESLAKPAGSGRVVDFFFSPASRYSYLAASQMPALEAETGCRVEWRPVNGVEIRSLRGRDPFAGVAVSGQYEWSYRRCDAERWAGFYGIPFREPPDHEFDFRLLARAATVAKRLGRAADYGWRLCSAVYGSDEWPLDEAVCLRIAQQIGLEPVSFASMLDDHETRSQLTEAAREARARGAFGVPTFFVGDEMFWGNDRIAILREALLQRVG
jgi:2-hydroxychromene-2-carboxylate isomerase